jgi:cation:H+ antiporter
LILGICAIIKPLVVKSSTVWKEIPFAIVAALSVLLLGYAEAFKTTNLSNIFNLNFTEITGYLSFAQGVILLIFFTIYMYYNFGLAKNSDEMKEDGANDLRLTTSKSVWYILGGLALLIAGGQVAVYAAVEIAKTFGISQRIIGLTIVAIGTSLPELVTSVKATLKGEVDIAIGNVVGSNIFNIFLILGISSLFGVLTLSSGELIDSLVGIAAAVILFVSTFTIKKSQIGRIEGSFMILIYFVYLGYLILGK